MAGKARVHELAKEFGVPSKNVLEALKEMGEFVKSASSTVEAPVVRRLEETKGPEWKAAAEAKAARAAKAAAKKAAKTAEPEPELVSVSSGVESPVATPGPALATAPRAESSNGVPTPNAGVAAVATVAEQAERAEPPVVATPVIEPPAAPAASVAAPEAPTTPDDAPLSAVPRPSAPKPSGPRPGNNPFSSTQGMQRSRRPDPSQPAAPAHPPAARSTDRPGEPRPPRPGGVPGAPRPNPAMMPRQTSVGAPATRGRGAPVRSGWTARAGRCRRTAHRCSRSWRAPLRRWPLDRRRSPHHGTSGPRPEQPRYDPGRLRTPERPVQAWPQVEAGAAPRVRTDAGPDDQWRARPQG